MEQASVNLLALRILISVLGVLGNTLLIVSILHAKRLKSFEVFLLGLALANLEEIVVVDVYDVLLLRVPRRLSAWSCRALKFLTQTGEISSILFTALISIYRYQKLRDTHAQDLRPVCMDHLRSAVGVVCFCAAAALLFAAPTLLVDLDWTLSNSSSLACPVDFFQCSQTRCPTQNRVYKFSVLLLCYLLPLLVVTMTGALIMRVLRAQQRAVRARLSPGLAPHHSHSSGFQRGTLAVLAAMLLFQLNWSVYLLLHLAWGPYSFPFWTEVKFFITTFYTTASPYVYGIGNHLFTVRRLVGASHTSA